MLNSFCEAEDSESDMWKTLPTESVTKIKEPRALDDLVLYSVELCINLSVILFSQKAP